jgi:hypothetical protein
MSQKVLAASAVVLLLVGAPLGLAAQEREVRGAERASVPGWLAGIWGVVTAWFGGSLVDGSCSVDPDGCPRGATEPPQPRPGSTVDGTCSLDPDGCPHGAAAPAQPLVDSAGDGRCSLDPNGCPGGA